MYDARSVDPALHVDRRVVEVGVDLELHDDRGSAFLRGRAIAVEIVDAVDLVFDRLDDQPLHLGRRGAGIDCGRPARSGR